MEEETRSEEPSGKDSSKKNEESNNRNTSSSRFICGFNNKKKKDTFVAPDADFHSDCLIKLTNGVTAYRIIEPKEDGRRKEDIPIIVCLHGLYTASYIWADIADLLSDFEQGPNAKILIFDFYGHGRSPWTGVDMTLDTLVTQTKELMDYLELSRTTMPAAFVGYDMGAAVATGFAAKYPSYCSSLSLLSPIGIKFKLLANEKLFRKKYIGEYLMMKQKKKLPLQQENEFFDRSSDSNHRYLIDKQVEMVKWQIMHTPGYLGAILSTYRNFPVRDMEELYTAVGRHPRRVLVILGKKDKVSNFRKCLNLIEESFPEGNIVDIEDCGHNIPAEKFEEATKELLAFNREVFEIIQ